jgi:galactose mutarotase-like enzyme
MSDDIVLRADTASACVSLHGAEWRAWRVEGRDLLWQADPAFWADTAPILFPVVGWTRDGAVRVAGETYPLGLHGFARDAAFDVLDRGAEHVTLRLRDTHATRRLYPFRFTFDVGYRLEPTALHMTLDVTNCDDGPMPYACGVHPGFAWPFAAGAKDSYQVVFDAIEDRDVPIITAAGLFSDARRTLDFEGRTLSLGPDAFAREALCFLEARSGALDFVAPNGSAIRVEMRNFPHVALWSRPSAPFLAIEAWTGHGDPDGYDGDLFAKPSMRVLDPTAHARHEVSYRFIEA